MQRTRDIKQCLVLGKSNMKRIECLIESETYLANLGFKPYRCSISIDAHLVFGRWYIEQNALFSTARMHVFRSIPQGPRLQSHRAHVLLPSKANAKQK